MQRVLKDDYIHGGTQKDLYEEKDKEACTCPLCGSDEFKQIDEERGLGIANCLNCNLLYTNPTAVNADKNYFGESDTIYNEARLIFKGRKKHHRDRNYIYEVNKIRKLKPNGKLLDIGTNMGFFLRKAREAGFEVEGVEPSPSLSKIAEREWGMKIYNSFLQELDLPEKSYDVITMVDVFEHVINPQEMLKSCYSLLKDDGVLAIKVPNGAYNKVKMKLAKRLGKKGVMDIWDSYEHVVHYTYPTMKHLVAEHGFIVKSFFVPLPIHSPEWARLVGHYYQYPSPFIFSWKKIMMRRLFFWMGKLERIFGRKTRYSPDLFFLLQKA
ncbi:MAG: hypothetical protein C0592_04440 [Marinilabiliales bacterium]|nr:MAG: hypothetical protein C0592_04440 [Marinilabiliales bacterium]